MKTKETVEYFFYRDLYLQAIKRKVFPWEAAYFYYCETTDHIDIFPFEDFKQSILQESYSYTDEEDAYELVSLPIYEKLERYFMPITLYNKEDIPLMIY